MDTIVRNMNEYGIHRNGRKNGNPRIGLTPLQLEVISGALLGDGSLLQHSHGGNAYFSYLSKSRQHVEFVAGFLGDFITKRGLVDGSYFDKRTNKRYCRTSFRTMLNVTFTELKQKWYGTNHYKQIPNDLILTPIMCLIWYIGDGGLMFHKRGQSIKLSTHSFSITDIEQTLLPQLQQFHAVARPADRNKPNGQHYIYIPRCCIKSFLEYIGECPFEDYRYKWKYKEYINKPPLNHKVHEKQFVELYSQGWTYYKIAKHFKIEPSAVRHYLIKHNIYKKGG